MRKYIIIYFLLFIFSCTISKSYKPYLGNKYINLFTSGLYIENLSITIPWILSFNELPKFGNPKIISRNKFLVELRWDSVKILNGTDVQISCLVNKKRLNQNLLVAPPSFLAIIAVRDIERVKQQFEQYSGKAGKPNNINSKKNKSFYWFLDNCSINVGWDKNYGGYMVIQRPITLP